MTSVNVVNDDEVIEVVETAPLSERGVCHGRQLLRTDARPARLLLAPGKEEMARLGQAVEESRLLETDDMICDEIGPILERDLRTEGNTGEPNVRHRRS